MRTCSECPRQFQPNRPHHVCCSQECRSQRMVRLQVEAAEAASQRVSHGVGSRGGTVHSLEQADKLHAEHKAEWRQKIAHRIAETLLATGYFHADDLELLKVPEAHSSIIGAQTGAFVTRAHMVEVGRRRSMNKAAHGRKSGIYEVTAKGREELPKLAGVSAGVPTPQGPERSSSTSGGASTDPDKPTKLFPDPPSMFDPGSRAA